MAELGLLLLAYFRAVGVAIIVAFLATLAVALWAWRDHRRHRTDPAVGQVLPGETDEPVRYRGRRRRPRTGIRHVVRRQRVSGGGSG